MRNTQKIIDMIRTGQYPEHMLLPLMQADASTVVERITTGTGTATIRGHIVDYVREVYDAAATIITREVRLRAAAALDAADAVSKYQAQRHEAVELVRGLLDGVEVTPEQWAAIGSAPVFVARVLLGDVPPGVRPVDHAVSLIAGRDARIEALKAKAARS